MNKIAAVGLLGIALMGAPAHAAQETASAPTGKVRTYHIAADEVDWDYAPGGVNKMMAMKFEGYSTVFTERGPHCIGTVYRKALYREYTDDTFTRIKPRPSEWKHTGILGPILRAEVGDTIHILFKNNATRPYKHAPAWRVLPKRFGGSTVRGWHFRNRQRGRCGSSRQDSPIHVGGS